MSSCPMENYTDHANVSTICEKYTPLPVWCPWVLISLMVVVAILAIFGNGIIILVERKNRCKTSTDWLVCFMAANDLTYSIVNVPIKITKQFGNTANFLCKTDVFFEKWTMYSSTLLLATIALDRYWKTCRPHGRFLTQQRALRVCIAITVVSIVVSSPMLTMIASDDQPSSCIFVSIHDSLIQVLLIIIAVTFVIVFGIICVCYTKVAFTIKHKLIQNNVCPQGQLQMTEKVSAKPGGGPVTSDSKRSSRISRGCKVVPEGTVEAFPKAEASEPSQLSQGSKSGKYVLFDSSINKTVPTAVETLTGIPKVRKRQVHRSSLVDRTSRIMFSVTMVFLLSWLPPWIVAFYERSVKEISLIGRIFIYFGEETFIVNTFANPIFYIWLSSAFKEKAIIVLKSMRIRQRR